MQKTIKMDKTSTFQIGDRVKAIAFSPKGEKGTVVGIMDTEFDIIVNFDSWVGGHDGIVDYGITESADHDCGVSGFFLKAEHLEFLYDKENKHIADKIDAIEETLKQVRAELRSSHKKEPNTTGLANPTKFPSIGDEYYFFDQYQGTMDQMEWEDDKIDNIFADGGSIFKTKEEAEEHRLWLKARSILINKIAELNGDWKYQHGHMSYSISYDSDWGELECIGSEIVIGCPANMMLKSKKLGDQIIEEYEDELMTFLGISI